MFVSPCAASEEHDEQEQQDYCAEDLEMLHKVRARHPTEREEGAIYTFLVLREKHYSSI